jgi:hypothetical protein
MNERILKLKQQAEAYVDSVDSGLGIEHYRQLVDQKFAELIVRECVDIAYKFDEPKLSGPGMIIGNRIEEHFGVEE